MRILLVISLAAGLTSVTSLSTAHAQGRGTSLSQASKAGRHGDGAGIPSNSRVPGSPGGATNFDKGRVGRSSQGLTRAADARGGEGAVRSPSASGLNHSLKGRATAEAHGGNARRADDARDEPTDQTTPEGNAKRIREQRLDRAEHLRQVSGANGNERLNTTADRMEANAQKNYQRRAFPVAPVTDVTGPTDAAAESPKGAPVTNPPAVPTAKSSWLPSWLRR